MSAFQAAPATLTSSVLTYAAPLRCASCGPKPTGDEATDPYCPTATELDALLDGAPWRRIVGVGDSTVEGLGDPVDGYLTHGFVERLVAALRRQQPHLYFLNLGRRNLVAAEVRATQLEAALSFGPDLAIVICGGNDVMPRDWDLDSATEELDAIVGALSDSGAEVVMNAYMTPVNAVPAFVGTPLDERLPQLNDRIRRVAERHNALLVDLQDSPASFVVENFSRDFRHLSMRGHAIVACDFARRLHLRLRDGR
jgi:lysophospholipase L1-like esterase